jgi:hypothetical protein
VTGGCGCPAAGCGCGGRPQTVANPPGLAEIAYRAGDFASFRSALLTPLPGERELSNWSPVPGDLGLQVLEWWAYLADVLAFYNERIANSSYLRTAAAQPGPRRHAAGLAGLLGYLPRPAVTASGFVAAIRSAGAPGEQLVIPAGLQITSTPSPGVPAQVYEVGDRATGQAFGFTGPSDAPVGLPGYPALFQPVPGDGSKQSVLLAGRAGVTPGEPLLLVRKGWTGTTEDWAYTAAETAKAETAPDGSASTRVVLAPLHGGTLPGPPPPPPATDPAGVPLARDYRLLTPTATALLLTVRQPSRSRLVSARTTVTATSPIATPPAPPGPGGPAAQPAGAQAETFPVPLATLIRNVAPGDDVLFLRDGPDAVRVLAKVTGYQEEVAVMPLAPGPVDLVTKPEVVIPYTSLMVRATGTGVPALKAAAAVRGMALGEFVMRYRFRKVGTLIPAPATRLGTLGAEVTAPAGLVTAEKQVMLQDANGAGLTVAAKPAADGSVLLRPLDGDPATLAQSLTAPIRLLADLIPVSQGTTVLAEVLGSGNPAAASQSFVLQHAPLVHLPPAAGGGRPVSTLSVAVNGAAWAEVAAFSGQAPDSAVYVTAQLPDGRTQVRFGDGVNGARLPLGVSNITATYRYGTVAPPPPAGRLTTVLQPQPNLATVASPVQLTPGQAAEPARQTAQAAPATVALVSSPASAAPPVISPGDCERLAATVTGVARARAYWTWDQAMHIPAVTLYVGGGGIGDHAAAKGVQGVIPSGSGRVPLHVEAATAVPLMISCCLLSLPGTSQHTIKAAAEHALSGAHAGLFSPQRMAVGQPLYRSEVEAALSVTGVAAVLSLRIRRTGATGPADPAGGHPADDGAAAGHPMRDAPELIDPGQAGYFSLPAKALSIEVVS